jgi:hypothetical protein
MPNKFHHHQPHNIIIFHCFDRIYNMTFVRFQLRLKCTAGACAITGGRISSSLTAFRQVARSRPYRASRTRSFWKASAFHARTSPSVAIWDTTRTSLRVAGKCTCLPGTRNHSVVNIILSYYHINIITISLYKIYYKYIPILWNFLWRDARACRYHHRRLWGPWSSVKLAKVGALIS